jgi:hypothetical protein
VASLVPAAEAICSAVAKIASWLLVRRYSATFRSARLIRAR